MSQKMMEKKSIVYNKGLKCIRESSTEKKYERGIRNTYKELKDGK